MTTSKSKTFLNRNKSAEPLKTIIVKVNGHNSRSILDSGSSVSIISSKSAKKLNVNVDNSQSGDINLNGINQTSLSDKVGSAEVQFTLKTQDNETIIVNSKVFVIDISEAENLDCLIGRNILYPAFLDINTRTGLPILNKEYKNQKINNNIKIYKIDAEQINIKNTKLHQDNQPAYEQLMLNQQTFKVGNALNDHQKNQLTNFLLNNFSIFSLHDADIGKLKDFEFVINTPKDMKPIAVAPYKIKRHLIQDVRQQLDDLLRMDIIEESNSSFNLGLVCVERPGKKVRICIDFRPINAHIPKLSYPCITMDDILAKIKKSSYFSNLDLRSAFHSLVLHPDSREMTAFTFENSQYQFKRACFGISTIPSTFQKIMNKILEPVLSSNNCLNYLDDCLIFTSTFEEHIEVLTTVFHLLLDAGLKLNTSKNFFCVKKLKFLGYIFENDTCSMSDESIKSILELPSPKTHKQLMQVNGTLSYFRRFLPDFATLSASFTNLLKKNNKEKFVWTEEAEADFQQIKRIITQTPVLKLFDSSLPTELRCDCSDLGASGVLLQLHGEKKWYPVMYCSKKLNATQKNYTTTHKELLAIVYSVARFEQYLYNIKFTIITDHNSLIFIQTATKLPSKLLRWAIYLSTFDYIIKYKPGINNKLADGISRLPTDTLDVNDLYYQRTKELIEPSDEIEEEFLKEKPIIRGESTNLKDYERVFFTYHIRTNEVHQFTRYQNNINRSIY